MLEKTVPTSINTYNKRYSCYDCIHFNNGKCEVYTHLSSEALKASWFPETCPEFKLRKEEAVSTAVDEATISDTKIEYQGTKLDTNPHNLMGERICGLCIYYDDEWMYCKKLVRHLISPNDPKAQICPGFKPREV